MIPKNHKLLAFNSPNSLIKRMDKVIKVSDRHSNRAELIRDAVVQLCDKAEKEGKK